MEQDSLFGSNSVEDILNNEKIIDKINYTEKSLEESKEWSDSTGLAMVRPTETLKELEDLYYEYNSMLRRHQLQSDKFSKEIFGVDNTEHYEYLKSLFLKGETEINLIKDIRTKIDLARFAKDYLFELKEETPKTFASVANKFLNYATESSSYQSVISNTINGVLADRSAEIITDKVPYEDMPYFTPNQMVDLGIAPSIVSPENLSNGEIINGININEWFYNYKMNYMGFTGVSENNQSKWVKALKQLCHESNSEERDRKILSLGWNPNIDFNTENRIRVNKIQENFMSRYSSRYQIIDARDSIDCVSIQENKKILRKSMFKPLYIVCIKGKCPITDIITKFTNSDVAHSTISFDASLHEMRSFGAMNFLVNKDAGLRGGPTIENIYDYPEDNPLYVYCIFPTIEQYNAISKYVKDIEKNAKSYSYSYKTLLTIVFNREYQDNMAMVCSEFVDKVIKLANLNIGKDSSLVSPEDIKQFGKTSGKIFSMFSGVIKDYDASKVERITEKLLSSPAKIKAIMNSNEMANNSPIKNKLIESCDIDIPTEMVIKNKPIWYDREFLFNIIK